MDGWLLLLVIVGAVVIAGFAKRLDLQVPLVLVAVGSVASFVPGLPRPALEPELLLGVILPPLLYSTALNFSFRSFRHNIRSIVRLGVGLVVVTTVSVGYFSYWLVPELTLGAALVLGAVVAPPDAVAAVAVGRKLGLPARMMAILTGESLVNDAAALTLFTITVASVTGSRVGIDSPLLFFLYEVVGGVAVGYVLSRLVRFVRSRMADSALETVLGILVPFTAYLAAEQIHASGVLAVVTAGFVLGSARSGDAIPTRIQERHVWPTLDLLLETFVFAYMGLQLKFVIDDISSEGLPVHHIFLYGLLVLALVMAVRPVMLFAGSALRRVYHRARSTDDTELTWRQNIVLSWAGMRGVVTLAAAAGVPFTTLVGDDFPGRGVIQAIAFTVAVGTLLIQGVTLPLVIRRLDISDPDEARHLDEQRALARQIARRAVEESLDEAMEKVEGTEAADVVDRVRRVMLGRLRTEQDEDDQEKAARARSSGAVFDRWRRTALRRQREALLAARDAGDLDDEVLAAVLDGLDIEQAATETRLQRFMAERGRE
ncbi:Na+/H+ antiporter [Rhodococcus sp. BP-349]|uniref:Na+/H+ antiporter n=1 Tax=unclassified Rhodococcus (in: high G+C Gram-positive bacteria) TaxID=192944 RepID=UPI001C9B7655|nr:MULTISPECIES: Na+/H+ antiporter [unclassified Rhodococcus (in: high G+C Gram-positive bacteria)]MBY6538255.1 Na+/H+ antiporter [Rhodococcus sp. BP-363]MBY6542592.1 Na+/H+ antiporter [Rhodococcus sp. BP-369]MBY6561822.1 Na+/H+ antiporter [Rhodococcus sp. BP-370]MBY6576114.1 Na+/H+ antiporter [Rhodococcus sp. BP-364]MBY6585415.1 Na+/H+ antiporter [Rhodococcus sp. BP-358]